jgi:CO/xanthine dehydrogenase Mo-binding subunit
VKEDSYKLLNKWLKAEKFCVVGKSIERTDALDKVLGRAKYVEDYFSEGMLFASLVKSKQSHALIQYIDISEVKRLPSPCSILTAKDIPGINEVGYAIPDQPLLANKKVRFHGEPIALAIAKNPDLAKEASELVKVRYKPLPAIFDPGEAINSKILVHEEHGSNIVIKTKASKGDIKEGFSKAEVIVEHTYRTHYQDHAYLETEGALAFPTSNSIRVIGSIQYPHLAQRITARVLGLKIDQVEVTQAAVGGAFGGKDDMGPLLCAQAALVASKLKKPAMITYSREDSIIAHCKRDPAIIKYKSGASKNGKLLAIDGEIIFDSGAYANRGPFTLWRATMHASGPYEVPNARVLGYLVYTNKVFQGSMRGFGNPPIQFATESQMDELAEKLGLDPLEFRLKNLLKKGSYTLTNQLLEDPVGIGEALSKVGKKSNWKEKRREYKKRRGKKVRGIGVACGWHGISTSRGVPDWSNALIRINRDGKVIGYTGIVEIGQGTHTGHAQLIAEILGIPTNYIKMEGGTTTAPDTGATHASRGISIGGIGLILAAGKLRQRIEVVAGRLLACSPSQVKFDRGLVYSSKLPNISIKWEELIEGCYKEKIELSADGYFSLPKGKFDEEKGQGFAYPTFSYIVNIAEVEVDLSTGLVKVLKVWPALASGKIINPVLVEGQVEGAIAQGLGYTLMEEVALKDGIILNPNFTDYIIPTSFDMPQVEKPVYAEDLFRYGPFGAKGVGEMALIPTPPAIANAIYYATGIRMKELPTTPEKLYWSIKDVAKAKKDNKKLRSLL